MASKIQAAEKRALTPPIAEFKKKIRVRQKIQSILKSVPIYCGALKTLKWSCQ